MSSEFRERDKLYSKLREVLGTDQAATLMGLLPDQDQFATKQDVLAIKSDILALKSDVAHLDERIDRIEAHMVTFDQRLWDFHEALRSQTRVYITATVSSMIGVGALSFAAAALV